MASLYPLRFEPILRRYLWGGRRLQTLLGKPLGPGDDYAESWELVDHGDDQSVVAAGPLSGTTLHDLVAQRGRELLGRHYPQHGFPLLVKFLDVRQNLSVQVHPDDRQAAALNPPDRGKTEAWYVLATQPGAVIHTGLKRGFDRAALVRELSRGTCELCLNRFEPRPGDCVLVPAGTVHALGAGLVVAELQQASDTTFRLYDWDRLGPDGKPRPLHIEQALEAIDFQRGPVGPLVPRPRERPDVSRLAECDHFVWDRWQLDGPQAIGGDDRCHILTVVAGQVRVEGDPSGEPLRLGQTMLLPAAVPATLLAPQAAATVLDAYLP